FGLPYSQTFVELSCIDEKIAIGKITAKQLARGTLDQHYGEDLERALLKEAKSCKDELETDLQKASEQPQCTGHAMLGNIYGGQAHELVADFTCPKPSTEFSLSVPSGYQITGGQASNAASSGGYSCNLNASSTTVDCAGNAPAGS